MCSFSNGGKIPHSVRNSGLTGVCPLVVHQTSNAAETLQTDFLASRGTLLWKLKSILLALFSRGSTSGHKDKRRQGGNFTAG
jgi:hypothetical protein